MGKILVILSLLFLAGCNVSRRDYDLISFQGIKIRENHQYVEGRQPALSKYYPIFMFEIAKDKRPRPYPVYDSDDQRDFILKLREQEKWLMDDPRPLR